jgi:polyhydroxyalkanoate synthesis regulator phasin
MTFTVKDVRDLVQLLEKQPEWRAELRRVLLTEEILSLPELVRELVQAQRHTDEQLAILTQRVDSLAEQVQKLGFRVDALTRNVDRLAELTDALKLDVSSLKGSDLERRYREKGPAYFGRIVKHIYVLSANEVSKLVYQAMDEGKISEAEADELILADVILHGRRREDGVEVYLVVEVSSVVAPYDVERATTRANILAKLGTPTIPVVAGLGITSEAATTAKLAQVWQVLDGRTYAPNEAPVAFPN